MEIEEYVTRVRESPFKMLTKVCIKKPDPSATSTFWALTKASTMQNLIEGCICIDTFIKYSTAFYTVFI